jgi:CheY-like chemotaxis protein
LRKGADWRPKERGRNNEQLWMRGVDSMNNELTKSKKITHAAVSKGKVLVMDDEDIIRELIRSVLVKCRYKVSLARDGIEAINRFKKAENIGHPFDVVILDIHVSEGMAGDEAIVKLREMDADVRAILLTGDITHQAVAHYEKLGFKAAIIKPFTRDELLEAIRRASVPAEGLEVN